MSLKNLNKISKLILDSQNILIVSHYDPDGDAIGSSMGLYYSLKKIGKNCYIYNRDKFPEYLNFLEAEKLINTKSDIPNNIELVLFLDLNDFERAGEEIEKYIDGYQGHIAVIDHHQSPKIESEFMLIDVNASATAILIYKIIVALGIEIDNKIATCLMTGIITDTSSFKNSNVNTDSFLIASKLLNDNADLKLINSNIYNDRSIYRLNLEKRIFSTILFDDNSRVAICYCTLNDYKETKTSKEDSEGIANFLLNHKEVEVGIFIREIEKNSWKASLRSNGFVDLSKIANTFGGGGHKNASGLKYQGSIEKLRNDLIDKILNEK